MEKEIIVLAKSFKRGGFCVAGIDTSTGDWIRTISNNAAHEGSVPLEDVKYEDGVEVQVLDRVKIQFLSHNPSRSQPENYMYNSEYYWKKTGKSKIEEVVHLRGYDDTDKIFYNTSKEITDSEITGGPSLLLLRVNNPYIFIKTFESQKIQLNFNYNNINYKYFKISDPEVHRYYSCMCDGNYGFRDHLDVVFSLTDKFHATGRYYKMAAQIFY